MKKIILLFIFIFLFKISLASPEIEIENPWVREASKFDGVSAAYLIIKNNGNEPDYLIDVSSNVAQIVQIHKMTYKNGVAGMERVKEIKIPPKSKVELTGKYHIMLVKLKKDLKAGEHIKLTLIFKKSGKINVDAVVKNPFHN